MATATLPLQEDTTQYPTSPSKNLQCTLCLRKYQDARILPCLHTFCACCLETNCVQQKQHSSIVYCPICLDETELSPKGIQGLPKNMYVQHLQELQRPPSPEPICDLCTDNETAVSHCEMCGCFLCEFCVEAHLRQRKTSQHMLVSVEDQQHQHDDHYSLGFESTSQAAQLAEYCPTHPQQELKLFCDTCSVPICKECSTDKHFDHVFLPLEDVDLQYMEILQNVLTQAKCLVATLNESMKNIEFMMSSVREQSRVVAKEICDSIDLQMRTLQEHKRFLLTQLDAVKQHKENTLEMQLEGLKKVMESLTVNCTMAGNALRQGNPRLAFSSKSPVASQLEETSNANHDFTPNEDDYIKFYRDAPAGKRNGLEVFGVLDTKGPSAAHSVVEGEGLFEARQGKPASFKVTVHDRYSQRRASSGDNVEAQVTSRTGVVVETVVKDCKNASYLVSYTPENVGEHRLSVLIDGKHIRASPFVVNVLPKCNKHRGIFHCCTFCSSEGKKHVRCGCGGTMPGGYSGCGHGHPTHPGCWHWSCCGSTDEKSDCLL